MSCEKVQKLISPLLDGRIAAHERETLLTHLSSCGECCRRLQSMENLRAELRRTPAPMVPPYLAEKLRVLAMSERVRQISHTSAAQGLTLWATRLQLFAENLMRPLALPFAGGLLSAVVVFSMIFLPSFRAVGTLSLDPSIDLATPAIGTVVNGSPLETPGTILHGPALPCDETIVELTIDGDGSVRDWNIIRGHMNDDVFSMIVWSRFIPATYFGRPVASKVQVALHGAERAART